MDRGHSGTNYSLEGRGGCDCDGGGFGVHYYWGAHIYDVRTEGGGGQQMQWTNRIDLRTKIGRGQKISKLCGRHLWKRPASRFLTSFAVLLARQPQEINLIPTRRGCSERGLGNSLQARQFFHGVV